MNRAEMLARLRRRLQRDGFPRLTVTLILTLTGLVGFATSFVLLQLHVHQMWLRYPLAVMFGYAAFLLLLRLWLTAQTSRRGGDFMPDVNLEITDAVDFFDAPGTAIAPVFSGGGGDFGGAGAGGSWELNADVAAPEIPSVSAPPSGSGFSLPDLDFGDAEGCLLPLIVIGIILAGAAVAFYAIYTAPVLLAEILLDGLLMTGLYRRLKKVEPQHWLAGAVRKTIVPTLLLTATLIAAGWAMQRLAPRADSIGDIWQIISTDDANRKR